jgi:hypothetical protein
MLNYQRVPEISRKYPGNIHGRQSVLARNKAIIGW